MRWLDAITDSADESEQTPGDSEELKSLLMKVKEESGKVGLNQHSED